MCGWARRGERRFDRGDSVGPLHTVTTGKFMITLLVEDNSGLEREEPIRKVCHRELMAIPP